MVSHTRRRVVLAMSAVLGACILALSLGPEARAVTETLPDRLTGPALWALSSEMSEPDGYFRSDNLVSNEIRFQHVIPDLAKTVPARRVYLGVGPEQNFSYIAALDPAMVFIVDVRRGNLHLHLMYKALFELSADRAEFVSRLFSKPRPPGLKEDASAREIFAAFGDVETSEALYKENLAAIENHLLKTLGLPLSSDDLKGIEYVYYQFFWYGPGIQYWSSGGGGRGGRNAPTYADLMVEDDGAGHARSFMASEQSFQVLKKLETKNLLVPVVGNFAGPKALKAVGQYVREHGGTVAAFYLSNVEQYLGREGVWSQFCANVSTLPLDPSSTFIRSVRSGTFVPGVGLDSELGNMITETRACGVAGAADLLSRVGALVAGRSPGPRPPSRGRH